MTKVKAAEMSYFWRHKLGACKLSKQICWYTKKPVNLCYDKPSSPPSGSTESKILNKASEINNKLHKTTMAKEKERSRFISRDKSWYNVKVNILV